MSNRVALSKKTRFEIFKRDGFTCRYCGKQPPDTVLEVDHINPVANGGDNDPLNLITSCFDCNRGKADKELQEVLPRPDADFEYLAVQQEISELTRYQYFKSKRDSVLNEVAESLRSTWANAFMKNEAPRLIDFIKLLQQIPPEIIEKAIYITSNKMAGRHLYSQYSYMCGVCWNLVKEKDEDDNV